jgi:hypothetical protein
LAICSSGVECNKKIKRWQGLKGTDMLSGMDSLQHAFAQRGVVARVDSIVAFIDPNS